MFIFCYYSLHSKNGECAVFIDVRLFTMGVPHINPLILPYIDPMFFPRGTPVLSPMFLSRETPQAVTEWYIPQSEQSELDRGTHTPTPADRAAE